MMNSDHIYAVHCWIKWGGALNVLQAWIRKQLLDGKSVDAIFTLYADRDQLDVQIDESIVQIPIITALPKRLNAIFRRVDLKKPYLLTGLLDYRNLMVFYPQLMSVLSKKLARTYDQKPGDVMISSYAVAKNITIPAWAYSEIYFHQPMHYIWTLYDEYVESMRGWKHRLYKKITPSLRRWDSQPRTYDRIYANSLSTQKQIQKLYFSDQEVDIQIVHPPIEERFFYERVNTQPHNYFLYINRLTKRFKHLDKIIDLCNRHQLPLLVAWDWPDKEELMAMAGPTITFVGWVSDIDTKIQLIKNAKGVFNIAHESFWIVTAECLLMGVPIFWAHAGATPELVPEDAGILLEDLRPETLDAGLERFLQTVYDRSTIQEQARRTLRQSQDFWK